MKKVIYLLGTLSVVLLLLVIVNHCYGIFSTNGPTDRSLFIQNDHTDISSISRNDHTNISTCSNNNQGSNILMIYSGRWKFLRIHLPHVYRELRVNGGVLDEVWFMMLRYDEETQKNIIDFTEVANKALQKKTFVLQYMGFPPGKPPGKYFNLPYFFVFTDMIKHPNNKYFKFDDDIVYVHPGSYKTMLDSQDSSKCFIHFFNIAGSNWRCSWLHQKMKVFEGLNPRNLKFGYEPSAMCGWKSPDCAELTLRTFLHHYEHNQLDKYMFEGLHMLSNRKRFSINAFLLDQDVIELEALQKVGTITKEDEPWWTVTYASKVTNPSCIVGEALVVHFAYFTVMQKMQDIGLLQPFEDIIKKNMDSFRIHPQVWKSLGYYLNISHVQ